MNLLYFPSHDMMNGQTSTENTKRMGCGVTVASFQIVITSVCASLKKRSRHLTSQFRSLSFWTALQIQLMRTDASSLAFYHAACHISFLQRSRLLTCLMFSLLISAFVPKYFSSHWTSHASSDIVLQKIAV